MQGQGKAGQPSRKREEKEQQVTKWSWRSEHQRAQEEGNHALRHCWEGSVTGGEMTEGPSPTGGRPWSRQWEAGALGRSGMYRNCARALLSGPDALAKEGLGHPRALSSDEELRPDRVPPCCGH